MSRRFSPKVFRGPLRWLVLSNDHRGGSSTSARMSIRRSARTRRTSTTTEWSRWPVSGHRVQPPRTRSVMAFARKCVPADVPQSNLRGGRSRHRNIGDSLPPEVGSNHWELHLRPMPRTERLVDDLGRLHSVGAGGHLPDLGPGTAGGGVSGPAQQVGTIRNPYATPVPEGQPVADARGRVTELAITWRFHLMEFPLLRVCRTCTSTRPSGLLSQLVLLHRYRGCLNHSVR